MVTMNTRLLLYSVFAISLLSSIINQAIASNNSDFYWNFFKAGVLVNSIKTSSTSLIDIFVNFTNTFSPNKFPEESEEVKRFVREELKKNGIKNAESIFVEKGKGWSSVINFIITDSEDPSFIRLDDDGVRDNLAVAMQFANDPGDNANISTLLKYKKIMTNALNKIAERHEGEPKGALQKSLLQIEKKLDLKRAAIAHEAGHLFYNADTKRAALTGILSLALGSAVVARQYFLHKQDIKMPSDLSCYLLGLLALKTGVVASNLLMFPIKVANSWYHENLADDFGSNPHALEAARDYFIERDKEEYAFFKSIISGLTKSLSPKNQERISTFVDKHPFIYTIFNLIEDPSHPMLAQRAERIKRRLEKLELSTTNT